MKAYPLQHKRLQRLVLPYIEVGTCEVMNLAHSYNMDSFNVFNGKNRGLYGPPTEAVRAATSSTEVSAAGPSSPQQQLDFLGEMVAGGLLDSYTGRDASTFASQYLAKALSMHTVVPAEVQALRKEDPDHPLVAILLAGLARRRGMRTDLESLVTEWDLQQYAVSADAAFFRACGAGRRVEVGGTPPERHGDAVSAGDSSGTQGPLPPEESGCRGVWFSATVTPTAQAQQQRRALAERTRQLAPAPQRVLASAEVAEEQRLRQLLEQTPLCLDVAVSCLGNSRAFGVARNPLTDGGRSVLDPARERTVPLSVDHTPLRTSEYRRITRAGGKVDSAVGDMIDGNPFYNVSRSFGHWSMKSDVRRSPVDQKMIALPTVKSWRMLAGDALVLCNHAVFETRHEEDTSMDELAKVVGRGLTRGLPAHAIAASLCDFAMHFGAEHSLQVMVAVAGSAAAGDTAGAASDDRQRRLCPGGPSFTEWVDPGPLYVGACRRFPELRRRLELDCARCDVTLAALLRRRWERVRHVLSTRHNLPLLPYYGRECGALQQVMEEEAAFFEREDVSGAADADEARLEAAFRKLARRLQSSTTVS
ncbi:protein phosphatase 2C [Novymonas esmeraldas]|uniref:Protein phosphatase 2C n=1 Tax=Novymonas esmeraldas TaxID=1808958 RepID=A0AAW0F7G2_9TRYP